MFVQVWKWKVVQLFWVKLFFIKSELKRGAIDSSACRIYHVFIGSTGVFTLTETETKTDAIRFYDNVWMCLH